MGMNTFKHISSYVLLILFLFFISVFHTHASTNVSSNLTVNTTWDLSGSPYIISNNIGVQSGVALTIDPGVTVKFDAGCYLTVFGVLNALGVANNSVVFTSLLQGGTWGGLDFQNGSTGNLSYIKILHSNNGIYLTGVNGITFSHFTMQDNGQGIVLDQGSVANLTNAKFQNIDGDAIDVYDGASLTANSLDISAITSGSAIVVYGGGTMSVSDSSIDGMNGHDAIDIFGTNTIFSCNNISVTNSSGATSVFNVFSGAVAACNNLSVQNSSVLFDAVEVYSDASLNITNSQILNGTNNAVSVFGHGTLNMSGSTVSGFAGVGVSNYSSSFGQNPDSITITSSEIKNNTKGFEFSSAQANFSISNNFIYGNSLFGAESHISAPVLMQNNWWGDASGPQNSTSNPLGLGDNVSDGIDFSSWLTSGPFNSSPAYFYSSITNYPGGKAFLYEQPTTSSTLVKTLPNDWVVHIEAKFDAQGLPVIADGYRWYQVSDPTDGSIMWMPSGPDNGSVSYLPYDQVQQINYQTISAHPYDGNGTNPLNFRKQNILNAINNYFTNNNTIPSLYSADDHVNTISTLANAFFSQELIMAITAQEDGPYFNNKNVSFDYGHGILQVTFDAHKNEQPGHSYTSNSNDPRGIASDVRLKKCKEVATDEYKKCYQNTSTYNNLQKPYDFYDHNPANSKYLQYANTTQSIFANIKDGLAVLQSKYGHVWQHPCSVSVIIGGLTYTCNDLMRVKAVWGYNGATLNPNIHYMLNVSQKLSALSTYFAGHVYNDNDLLIEKLATADANKLEIKIHSPVDLTVVDSKGNITGLVDGKVLNNIENSYYDPEKEAVLILFPHDKFTYQVVGNGEGSLYGLDIDQTKDGKDAHIFHGENIPIKKGEINTYDSNGKLIK